MNFYFCRLVKFVLSFSSLIIFSSTLVFSQNALATTPVETHSAEEYKPLARRLFERITGVKIAQGDVRVSKMAILLANGKPNSAIQIALKDPAFTNVRARNFALQLSNKANSLNVNLDDMSALITGIIRDDIDFREILTADYHYELSNGHSYKNNFNLLLENAFAESEGLYLSKDYATTADRRLPDLFLGLVKMPGIYVPISYNTGKLNKIYSKPGSKDASLIDESVVHTERHPDPAGVLTTRGFASSQYSGGTNRRPVEYVVRNFLCSSMGEIANNMASDAYVGKDVSRFPGGNHQTYLNSCKSCHTVMDSFRGAFAKSDFKQLAGQFGEGSALFHGDFGVKYYTLAQDWRNTYLFLKPQTDEQTNAKIGDKTQLLTAAQKMSEFDFTLYTPSLPVGAPATFADRVAWEKFLLQHKLFLPQAMRKIKADFVNALPSNSACTKNTTISTLINKLTDPAIQNSTTFTEKLADYSATPAAGADAKTICLNGLYNQMISYVNSQTDASWSAWKKESLKQVYLNNKIVFDLSLKKAKVAYDAQFEIDYFTPITIIIAASNARWSTAKKAYDAAAAGAANKAELLQAMNQEKEYFLQFADFVDATKINPMNGSNFALESDKKPVANPQLTIKQNYLNIRPAISNFVFTSEFLIPEAIQELKSVDLSLASFDFISDFKNNKLTSKVALHLIAKFQANGASAELLVALKDFILNKNNELLESDRFFVRTERRNYLESIEQWMANITPGVSQKTGVVDKMNNGSYPEGFEVVDDSFVNLSSEKYGWRGSFKSGGRGLGQFGQMISQSSAFSSCMSQKIFKEVCYKNISDPNEIKKWQGRFESLGYKVRALIGEIVQSPSCGLVEGGGQ